MDRIRIWIAWAGSCSFLVVSIMLSGLNISYAQQSGLTPLNEDGFETGDWRNFRPHYIGESDEFIRPNITLNETNPISGTYSLQWQADNEDHEWMIVSNAFYMELPSKVNIDFRFKADNTDWSIGLRLLETYDRFTGVLLKPQKNGRYKVFLEGLTQQSSVVQAESGDVLRLTISRIGKDDVSATIRDIKSGEVLAELEGYSSVVPEAIGIVVQTGSDSQAILNFDNVSVESATYQMRSAEWTRSPQFVTLPRLPEITQDQGNWVGGQTTMKKGDRYLMWYRMRDNIDRGRGYGFAESRDGLVWKKFDNPPVFTYDPDQYLSAEKISVLYVNGLFRAWYAVNAPSSWYTAYATSEDGINWDKQGLVIDEAYTKDAVVIYVNDTYYLYAIRENVNIGIHTSQDGVEWEHRNTIPMGVHRHIAATYVERTNNFHLYTSGGFAGVSQAISFDGVNFGPFRQVMEPSKVGLDDWVDAGVTYLSFLTDEHGKIKDDRQMPIYYQARNTWDNNIPGWLFHGSERVVLAGHYKGIFPGVKTTVMPKGGYEYHSFPFEIPLAEGIEIYASQEIEVQLDTWQPGGEILGEGSLKAPPVYSGHSGKVNTQVQWDIQNLEPGQTYELKLDHQQVVREQADDSGRVMFTNIIEVDDYLSFRIYRRLN